MTNKNFQGDIINYGDRKGTNQNMILNFDIRLRKILYSGSLIPTNFRVTVTHSYEK